MRGGRRRRRASLCRPRRVTPITRHHQTNNTRPDLEETGLGSAKSLFTSGPSRIPMLSPVKIRPRYDGTMNYYPSDCSHCQLANSKACDRRRRRQRRSLPLFFFFIAGDHVLLFHSSDGLRREGLRGDRPTRQWRRREVGVRVVTTVKAADQVGARASWSELATEEGGGEEEGLQVR